MHQRIILHTPVTPLQVTNFFYNLLADVVAVDKNVTLPPKTTCSPDNVCQRDNILLDTTVFLLR